MVAVSRSASEDFGGRLCFVAFGRLAPFGSKSRSGVAIVQCRRMLRLRFAVRISAC